MISRKQLMTAATITLVILVGLNVAIAKILVPHTSAEKKLTEIRNTRGDCIGLGNSLIYHAFVPQVFDRAAHKLGVPCTSVNAGLGASDVLEHLLLLREALRVNPHPKLIVYGFFDLQLSDMLPSGVEDLTLARNLPVYFEPDLAFKYYKTPLSSRLELALFRHVPMFVFRGHAYRSVTQLRERLQLIGLPEAEQQPTDRFLALALRPPIFLKTMDKYGKSEPVIDPTVRELLKEAKNSGARVVVVLVPLAAEHIATYYQSPQWESYERLVKSAVLEEGVEYLDASDWEPEASNYVDSVHLNENGSEKFSVQLANCLFGNDQMKDDDCSAPTSGSR